MNDEYFVITGSEDGGCYIRKTTKEQLLSDFIDDERKILHELPKEK